MTKSAIAAFLAASIAFSSLAVPAAAEATSEDYALPAVETTAEETTAPVAEETTVPETEETTVPETEETTVPETEETTVPETEETTVPETEETTTEEAVEEEEEHKDSYTSGDFEYTVTDGNATLVGYIGTSASVTIPSTIADYPVVSLSGTFSGNTTITNVTISSGVVTVGKNAFKSCTKLAKVTFPSTVTSIGVSAFEGCSVLTGITLPSNLTTIGNYAFKNCSKIGSVTFPAKLTSIGEEAFAYSGIKAVSLPASLTFFGYRAFYDCDYITSLSFFETIYESEYTVLEWGYSYGNDGFAYCDALTTVNLNNTHITVVPREMFLECSALKSVTLPSTITNIGYQSFYNCSVLPGITLPASVEEIDYQAFYSCDKLGTVNFPEKLKYVGEEAFAYSGIKTVSLPDSLSTFYYRAFYECDYLTSVSFYDSSLDDEYTVLEWGNYYGNDGFAGCDALTNVKLNNEHITTVPRELFANCPKLNSVTLPSSITSIDYQAFYNCSILPKITLPANVESIGYQAFYSCDQLASVNFPAKLTSVGEEAFAYSGIKSVSLPESLTSFGYRAFAECDYLTTVSFFATSYDDEYTTLEWGNYYGNDGFAGCGSLTTVKLNNEHITSIPRELFYECTKLNSVTLPTSVTSIGDYAFYNCDALTSFKLPANVESIGYQAFYSCSKLATINFPAKLTTVGDDAFRYTVLKTVSLPESLTYLGSYSFANCEYLLSVTFFPTSYDDEYTVLEWGDSYGSNAFNGCKSLISVKLSPYATYVPSDLFYNCTSLKSVTIPKTVTNIYSYAFYNCKALATVYFTGNATAWSTVTIETDGNSYLASASVAYRSVISPEISSISTSGGSVTVNWNALGNVTSYRVYRADSLTGAKTLLGAVTTNKYTDSTAEGGKTYYYFVVGFNSYTSGKSDYSAGVSVTTPVAPAKPTSVKAVSGGGNATITWNAVSGATSYRVYRSTSLSGTRTLAKVRTSTYYIDTNVDTGKTYYYWVVAYNANTGLKSAYSASANVKIVDTFTTKPVITKASVLSTSVTLTWDVVPGATSYQIFRRNDAGTRVLIKSQSMTEFKDTGLTKGKAYTYEIRAYSATVDKTTSFSAYKKARPMAAPTIQSGNVLGKITWDKNAVATSYRVYRANSLTGAKTLLAPTTSLTYTDTTAENGNTYYYFVAAYDNSTGTLSAYSQPKVIKISK